MRATGRSPSDFRPEIQALRAIAVLSVVLFHLWPNRVPGGFVGVDVFFAISGFLITAHLLRDAAKSGRPTLGTFWIRRIRRLLPAAFLVLGVTLVSVLVFVPTTLWQQFLSEIAASALYVENWVLAANSVDYFAAEQTASPVQHYWSLSAEEQFYLVWPLLLVGLFLLSRAIRPARRGAVIFAGMLVVALASLAYSAAVATESFGYFSTFTHAWEFAAGGLLALGASRIGGWFDRHAAVSSILSWVGYALIIAAVFAYSGATPFPGVAALLPITGAILVIAAGTRDRPLGPDRPVRLKPVQWVGNVSYSLYLWHWPPIVILPLVLAHPLTTAEKVGILVFAFVLAAVTKTYVEDRFRSHGAMSRRDRRRPLVALVVATGVIVGACFVPIAALDAKAAAARAEVAQLVDSECFGANSMLSPACTPDHTVTEQFGPAYAKQDTPIVWAGERYDDCPFVATAVRECVFGSADADTTIAMIGDSHVRQYLPALSEIATERGWQLKLIWLAGCRPALSTYETVVGTEKKAACRDWRASLGEVVADDESIDLVVTSAATRVFPSLMPEPATQQAIADGFLGLWGEWAATGTPVLVIRDNPLASGTIPDCVAASGTIEDPCAAPRDEVLPFDPMDLAIERGVPDGVEVLDLTGSQCDDEVCHFVVGGVITNYDKGHLSTTFVQSLEPYLSNAMDGALSAKSR